MVLTSQALQAAMLSAAVQRAHFGLALLCLLGMALWSALRPAAGPSTFDRKYCQGHAGVAVPDGWRGYAPHEPPAPLSTDIAGILSHYCEHGGLPQLGTKKWFAEEYVLRTVAPTSLSQASVHLGLLGLRTWRYPEHYYKGQGIVIVGGGVKYTFPAYISLMVLRKLGCMLPAELWLLPGERLPPSLALMFEDLGVSLRSFSEVTAGADKLLSGYKSKAFAIAASRFEEVLLLDADNIPLRDPAYLFASVAYMTHGAVLWPDFWRPSVFPDAWDLLGIPDGVRLDRSYESGQILINKRRHWDSLLLACYFNLNGNFYYPLFSGGPGQGDKETFPMAMLAVNKTFYTIPSSVEPVGYFTIRKFEGTAMLQHDPDGLPLFLHAHNPKLSLVLPEKLPSTRRRWASLDIQEITGMDLDLFTFNIAQQLRCNRDVVRYVLDRKALHDKFWRQPVLLYLGQPVGDTLFTHHYGILD